MKNLLWLASWFPEDREPLSGDFIERHARAASILNNITVIFVVRDVASPLKIRRPSLKKTYNSQLTVTTVYYRPSYGVPAAFAYLAAMKKAIDDYVKHNGKPQLIHVHVAYRAGIGALYAKWRHGIPYVISEHSTIYCPEAKPRLAERPFFERALIRKIFKNAVASTAVSEFLSACISKLFDIKKPVRIPNVVDTALFYPGPKSEAPFDFIHISTLTFQKNFGQILEAAALLRLRFDRPFRLIVYGPSGTEWENLTVKLKLKDIVDFRGEVPQDILSKELRQAHALILYSRFETFGCVVIEALASGVPVIVSDIPVMHELVDESTGVFADADDAQSLAAKMQWVMEHIRQFDSGQLSQAAANYSFEKVALAFDEFYKVVLGQP